MTERPTSLAAAWLSSAIQSRGSSLPLVERRSLAAALACSRGRGSLSRSPTLATHLCPASPGQATSLSQPTPFFVRRSMRQVTELILQKVIAPRDCFRRVCKALVFLRFLEPL